MKASRWLYAAAFGLAMLTCACAGGSRYMKEVAAPPPIAAPTDRATVVFLRPSGIGAAINFAILDQQGRWVGDAVSQAHFAVSLPPGEYMFIGWAENTSALKANVAAGRVYYVEVTPLMGLLYAQVRLEALTPRHDDWKSITAWLKETRRLEPLPAGEAYIAGRRDDVAHRIASAKENWDGYSAEDKARRTLRLEDGVVTTPPAAPAVDPTAAAPACAPGADCSAVAAAVPAQVPQPQTAPAPVTCSPACTAGFVCNPQGQCVSACNPPCGAGTQCSAAGTCIADAPPPPVARAGRTQSGPRDNCFPPCRKAYVCSPRGQCVSACNPPCAAGERCTEGGLCTPESATVPR